MKFTLEELKGLYFTIQINAGVLVFLHDGVEDDSWGSGELNGKAYNINMFLDEENNLCANVFECTQKNEDGTWNNDSSIEVEVINIGQASLVNKGKLYRKTLRCLRADDMDLTVGRTYTAVGEDSDEFGSYYELEFNDSGEPCTEYFQDSFEIVE